MRIGRLLPAKICDRVGLGVFVLLPTVEIIVFLLTYSFAAKDPKHHAFLSLDRIELQVGLWLMLAASLVIAAIASALIRRSISRPLHEIADVMRQMGNGDGTELPLSFLKRRDEIGALAHSFTSVLKHDRRTRGRIRAVLDNAAEGLVTVDEDGRIESFNRAAMVIFGFKAEEVMGKDVSILGLDSIADKLKPFPTGVQSWSSAAWHVALQRRLEGRPDSRRAPMGRRKDGTAFPIEVSIAEIDFRNERLKSVIVRDVSDREADRKRILELNAELEREKAELERRVEARTAEVKEAMKAQTEILDNVSHDLRAPMTVVLGYAEDVLRRARANGHDQYVRDLRLVADRGKDLMDLINDILNISRAAQGKKIELDPVEFDVADAAQDRGRAVEYLARIKGNEVVVGCGDDTGTMVADLPRVNRILTNLLVNACKFTQRGVIRLEAERERGTDGDWIVFRVHDTGKGMDSEQREKLFRRFETVHAESAGLGGTGLGLAICDLYARLMGGGIQVEHTQPGLGTTFVVRLPAQVDRERPRPNAPAGRERDPSGSAQVLIIDDDASISELMIRSLGARGIAARAAGSGDEGIRLAREARPAAIVLDVIMPGVDGWQVLKALKDDERTAQIPVIMATIVDDRERGLDLGADEFLTKPIAFDQLPDIVRKYAPDPAAHSVLVVEDDPCARERLARHLRGLKLTVLEAADVEEAIAHMDASRPDLLVLDLMLPTIEDGCGLIERVRAHPERRAVPILAITVASIDESRMGWLQQRVDRVLGDGRYTREELLDMIGSWVVEVSSGVPT